MSCKQKSKNQVAVPETLAVHGGYILKIPQMLRSWCLKCHRWNGVIRIRHKQYGIMQINYYEI